MTQVGMSSTRLIVLRGDSGSGKTTLAHALRPRLGARTALIHQDHFRRELLADRTGASVSADAAALIDATARGSLDLGYDVILDGVFNLRDYSELLGDLVRDHRGPSVVYQFDVGFDETVRRHHTRDLRDAFDAEEMRTWYDGWQPLPSIDERRIGAEASVDEAVGRILSDLRDGEPTSRR